METKVDYKVAVRNSPYALSPVTELDKLNQAKRRYRDATTCFMEGWRRRDDAIEAENWALVNEWDLTMDGFITRRDRAYAKLQLAHRIYDAQGECECTPISDACRACRAQSHLEHGENIPW